MSDPPDGPSSRGGPTGERLPPRRASAAAAEATGTSVRSLDPARRRNEPLYVGRLTEHGRAHYQFRAEAELSYYVKLLTSSGERTLWGKDLERAVREGQTQPRIGDLVGARRIAREAVTITSRHRDAEGRVVSQEERRAHRNQWVVERVRFLADRSRVAHRVRDEQADVRATVREHPELKSAFLSVRAAEEFASHRIADPKDRARFLELVRGAIAGSIQKGQPLPSVRLRNTTVRQQGAERPAPPRRREEPTR